jgi:hypothetical protein
MATPLFISRTDLVKKTIVNGNVDTDKFIQFIEIAQVIHIQNYLGTKLYDKISDEIEAGTISGDYLELLKDYIQPMLVHYAMSEYVQVAAYEVKNNGLLKHRSENADTPTTDEVDSLSVKYLRWAKFYTERFMRHMAFNAPSKFPEYNQNINDDMHPDRNNNFTGWNL